MSYQLECIHYGECPNFMYGLETHCFHEKGCTDFEPYYKYHKTYWIENYNTETYNLIHIKANSQEEIDQKLDKAHNRESETTHTDIDDIEIREIT